jgi:hypothetical protein
VVAEARQVVAAHSEPAAVVPAAQQDAVERQPEAAVAGAQQVSPPQVATAAQRDEPPAVAAAEPGARRAVPAAQVLLPGAVAAQDALRVAAVVRRASPREVAAEPRPGGLPSSSALRFAPGSAVPVPVRITAHLSKHFVRSMAQRPLQPKPGSQRERRRWRCRPARAI